MTDLLPHRDGQEDSITLEPGMAYISTEQVGHWYSPVAVAHMIEEARAPTERILARLASENEGLKALIRLCERGVIEFDSNLVAYINVNDMFVPAADEEELPLECACEVWRIYENEGLSGVITWVEKRRKVKEPK